MYLILHMLLLKMYFIPSYHVLASEDCQNRETYEAISEEPKLDTRTYEEVVNDMDVDD